MTQYLDLTALFESIKFNTGIDILKDAQLNVNTDMNIIIYDLYVTDGINAKQLLNDVAKVVNKFLADNDLSVDVDVDNTHNIITINRKIELIISGGNND